MGSGMLTGPPPPVRNADLAVPLFFYDTALTFGAPESALGTSGNAQR
ncbi:hypothetical protein GCM10010336_28650 [Streptomyces goshikiensis]|nr:hypothetical protein GCM10010336_28650 [Streptomyces goshikiensis]